MNPNQQNQTPQAAPPNPPSTNTGDGGVPQPQNYQMPAQPAYQQPEHQPAYDPNYLDSIAPAPPQPKFFSGTFGKLFFILIGVFVFAVSLIIAFSGKDNTADLQQVAVRLDNYNRVIEKYHPYIKSNNLKSINSEFKIWMSSSYRNAEELLKTGGVQKTDYDRGMVASEKQRADELDTELNDARLSARLNRVYASTMASEAEILINMYNAMETKSKSKMIRDYAKEVSANLEAIQKRFADFVDDGN